MYGYHNTAAAPVAPRRFCAQIGVPSGSVSAVGVIAEGGAELVRQRLTRELTERARLPDVRFEGGPLSGAFAGEKPARDLLQRAAGLLRAAARRNQRAVATSIVGIAVHAVC